MFTDAYGKKISLGTWIDESIASLKAHTALFLLRYIFKDALRTQFIFAPSKGSKLQKFEQKLLRWADYDLNKGRLTKPHSLIETASDAFFENWWEKEKWRIPTDEFDSSLEDINGINVPNRLRLTYQADQLMRREAAHIFGLHGTDAMKVFILSRAAGQRPALAKELSEIGLHTSSIGQHG